MYHGYAISFLSVGIGEACIGLLIVVAQSEV